MSGGDTVETENNIEAKRLQNNVAGKAGMPSTIRKGTIATHGAHAGNAL